MQRHRRPLLLLLLIGAAAAIHGAAPNAQRGRTSVTPPVPVRVPVGVAVPGMIVDSPQPPAQREP